MARLWRDNATKPPPALPAPGVQVAPLGERDQLLHLRRHRLCLRLAGLDPLVLDQLAREVAEQRAPVSCVSTQLVTGLAMTHADPCLSRQACGPWPADPSPHPIPHAGRAPAR